MVKKGTQWRLKPPGAAQKHLESLFSTGEIRGDMAPKDVYEKYDFFHKNFSVDVFKKNFYLTRDKLGTIDDNNKDKQGVGKLL